MLADLNPAMTMMGVPGVSPHSYSANNPHPAMTKSVGVCEDELIPIISQLAGD